MSDTTPPRYCKDCRWFRPASAFEIDGSCQHPSHVQLSLVHGPSRRVVLALYERASGRCGKAGVLFEPRLPPLGQRLLAWWRRSTPAARGPVDDGSKEAR